jgi:hypothetical protein
MSDSDDRRIGRIAGLTLVNALIFQEVLASQKSTSSGVRRVRPIRQILSSQQPVDELIEEWDFILDEIDYIPIFRIASEILRRLPSSAGVEQSIRRLSKTALLVTSNRALLRHDLMGRVYHRLLADAKYFGAFYTKIPSATLLLKLATNPDDWDVDWSDLEQISSLRVADLACGTGTLLKATLQSFEDNYVRSCVLESRIPALTSLHKQLIEDSLYGGDVLLFALHLTASALAMHEPDVPFSGMRLFRTFLGGPPKLLGSLDMRPDGKLPNQTLLLGTEAAAEQVTLEGEKAAQIVVPELDLAVMNPPFTRSVGGNLLFGSLAKSERKPLQKKLQQVVRQGKLDANITAGLGSVFVALADQRVKSKGHLALVLPRALTSGAAWAPTRKLLTEKYHVRFVIVSHEPLAWNFSENTKLSECLLVARKVTTKIDRNAKCTFVNLWERPKTAVEAVTLASLVQRTQAVDLRDKGLGELVLGDRKLGEVISQRASEMDESPWSYQLAFAQTDLCRAAYWLDQGKLYLPGRGVHGSFPMAQIRDLGVLGPDIRDVFDGFSVSPSETSYPAFWGHKADVVKTIGQEPNRYLAPLAKARKGRHLRDSELIWSRAGGLLLAERLRFNTQRLAAVRVDTPVLSNTWYPTNLEHVKRSQVGDAESLIALWFNSTPGLLSLFSNRLETEGAWTKYKKPTWYSLRVPDPRGFEGLDGVAKAYDALRVKELMPITQINVDSTRRKVDDFMAGFLGLDDFEPLREMLAREPILTMKKIG